MVKRKTKNRSRFVKTNSGVQNSDEEADREEDPDPSSRSYVYDEIDEFHTNREKILLDSGTRLDDSDESAAEDAVYGLSENDSVDDDEEDDGTDDYYDMKATALQNKEEMASDVDDEDDGLPDVKAWGSRHRTYYSTDFVDKDYDFLGASDEEMAEAEEKEALALQKKMVELMDDQDFGLNTLQAVNAVPEVEKESKIIERDLSSMSKQEKLEVLKMESPELLSLIEDFRAKLLLIKDKIQPLVDLVNDGTIPTGPGTDYLHVKHELLLNYCTNVCFYLMLKAERKQTSNHPIIKRLVSYRNLLKQLEPIDRQMESDMQAIVDCLNAGNDVATLVQSIGEQVQKKPKRRLEALVICQRDANEHRNEVFVPENGSKKKKKRNEETQDEINALQLYSLMKAGRKQTKNDAEVHDKLSNLADGSDSAEEMDDAVDDQPQTSEGDKRAITQQIAKNRGLMPYRKKINRNPRVKNRFKYRRAKIRRKGQVHEVRKEMKKYAGEISGIKATTSRSIKIK